MTWGGYSKLLVFHTSDLPNLQHRLLVYHVVVLDVGGKGLLNDGALAQQALYKIFILCEK